MKQFWISILLLFFFSSCYVYRPLEPKIDKKGNEIPVPPIKEQFQKDRLYKISVLVDSAKTKTYKIQFDQMEKDSVVGKLNANEKRVKRFNIKQIEQVRHRNFQPWYSNGLTILAYAGIAIGIILLL